MARGEETASCPRCGGKTARRVKDVKTDGDGCYLSHATELVCPKCNDVECFVEGCEKRATEVVVHAVDPDLEGQEDTGMVDVVWNDHCLCAEHTPLVRRCQSLRGRGAWLGLLGMVFIVCGVFITAATSSTTFRPPLIGLGVLTWFVAAFLGRSDQGFAEANGLVKKDQFCTYVGGVRDTLL